MNKEKITLAKLVWTYFVEWLVPSEWKYIIVAPSGNFVYLGPPLKTRVQKRLNEYYKSNTKNPENIADLL